MAAGRLALLCLVGLVVLLGHVTAQQECETPDWPSSLGSSPMVTYQGKVLLVALVKGYCQYCINQARNLELLKNHLHNQGFPDVEMILINGGDSLSRSLIGDIHAVTNLSVYQDTSSNTMYDQVFHGNKDDFIVYDRCGQRVAYIPHPYSYLGHTITERVLRAVHRGRHNCHCSLDYSQSQTRSRSRSRIRSRQSRRRQTGSDPHNQMQSDQPVQQGSLGTSVDRREGGSVQLDCPRDDRMCRRYSRRMRNGRLSNSQRRRNRNGCSHSLGQRGRRYGSWLIEDGGENSELQVGLRGERRSSTSGGTL